MFEKFLSQIEFEDDIVDTTYEYRVKFRGSVYIRGKIDLTRFRDAIRKILEDEPREGRTDG